MRRMRILGLHLGFLEAILIGWRQLEAIALRLEPSLLVTRNDSKVYYITHTYIYILYRERLFRILLNDMHRGEGSSSKGFG